MVDDGFRGRLLVATPALVDPNFARSVILLLEFGDEGAVGVVLNRPSGTPVADVLPDWSLHTGGVGVPPWTFFDGLIGTVDLTAGPDSVDDRTAVRVYAGYAGWGAEQLELEIEIGSWYVVDGSADDVFCREPDELWRAVLKRQPGQLAMVANFPMDPSLN
jgi:putative transcriptional regulator